MLQDYQQELDEFLKGKGLLGEPAPIAGKPQPATQDIQKQLDDFLWSKGVIELGGLRKETPETEVRVPPTPQEAAQEYMDEPGFWQQARDLSALASAKDPHMFSMVAEAALSGVSLRNQEHILNLVGKISGQPDLYNKFKAWQQKGLKKKLGYLPSPEVTAFVEAPTEVSTTLIPLTGIFKLAAIPAKIATKIPFLRALARAEITGTATGLLRKPEEEGLWNRLKQVPGDVGFFTLFEIGALGLTQGYKMYRWAKEFKGKPPKWAGTFSEYTPPPVPPHQAELIMSKEEFKELLRKITTRATGPESGAAFKEFISGLSQKEKDVFRSFHGKEPWNEVWSRVQREGIFRDVVDVPGRQPPPTKVFEAERVGIPRKPRFPDIFKPVDKYGRPIGAPEFEPFPEEPLRPARQEAPPPGEPPPRPEAPPPREAPPPEPAPPPREAPPAAKISPPEARPPATVEVVPTAEGGWTIKIPQPPAGVRPGEPIPWRPTEPDLLPPAKKPLKVIKPRKPTKYKDPFYEAINRLGGVAPNQDYPYSELKNLFPVGLIRKTASPMDVLAQSMRHEFPTIETDDDLWNMADEVRRGRAVFRDERTGEQYPPKEEIERQYEEYLDKQFAGKEPAKRPAVVPTELKRAEGRIKAHMEGKTLAEIQEIRKDLPTEEQEIVDRLLKEKERKPVEKPLRVAEKVPPAIAKEPSLSEIERVFDDMAIPRIKRGVLADQIIRNYKPEKGALKPYIKSILGKITDEGELRVKPTAKRAVRPARLTPEMEEVVAGRAERPEDIFERAEEEARVQKIFKESAKTDRERDVLDRKILKGQSYEDIGKAHGITRQRAEQIFKESFEKVKDHSDVRAMVKRKMRQANLGPIPSEQDLKDLGKFMRKYFSSTKGVDKVIDAVNDKRIGQKLAELFEATHEAKALKNFLVKNKNEALDAHVLDILKGDVPVGGSALPDEIKDVLGMMRDRIDKLSQLIMTHGGLTEQTKATFESNLGRYVGKYYRLHQQRRWDPPKEVRDRFKTMLKRNYPEKFGDFTEEELDSFIEGIINEERKFGFGGRRAKRVPTGHFKRRLRLSKEWKELAGEIHDPVWLYLKMTSDQSVMAYNAEFLNKIKQTYPDLWVTNTTEAEKKGWQKYRLPANYGYGELKNKYVHPELYNYIIHEVDPAVSGVERALMKFITNPFKWTKTIGSIPTHARNFQGNYMFSIIMRNSIFNPLNIPYYKDSIKTFMLRNKSMKKEWADLVKLGVTETQFWGAEIPKFYEEMLKLDPVKWPERLYNHTLKAGIARAGNAYNFEDALYRIASHYKNVRHFKMTPEESVEEINRGMTNYRKLPVVVEVLRRYPVFGPFISFRWNVGKIVTNQAVQGTKEMAKKGMRIKGSLRIARLLFLLGLPSLISKVSKEIFDVDDEQTKKLEAFYPKYRKNGIFAYFRGKEGQLKALDLTYIWPTGEPERAIKALRKGDIDTFKDAIDLFAHPVFDAWSILIEGRQPYWGTKIQGGFFKRMAEIAKLLWVPASAPIPSAKSLTESIKAGKFEPRTGALTGYQMKALIDAWNQQPDRYGRSRILSEEIKNFFTGLRSWNVEPDKVLMQSIKAMRVEASTLKWQFKGWLASNTKAPAWEIKDRKDDYTRRATELLEKAKEANELYKELKKGGFLVQKEK